MKKYLSLLFAVLVTLSIQSGENRQKTEGLPAEAGSVGWVGFSDVVNIHERALVKAICAFNRVVSSYPQRLLLKFRNFDEDSVNSKDEEETRLGLIAVASQLEQGISKNDRLPVKKKFFDNSYGDAAARADCLQIIYNPYKFPKEHVTLGLSRMVFLHEAAHAKNGDRGNGLVGGVVVSGSTLLYPYILRKLFKINLSSLKSNIIRGSLVGLYFVLLNQTGRYVEQRADIQAYSQLQCYKCAQEVVLNVVPHDEECEFQRGYLSGKRLAIFVDRYKQAGLLCPLHARREGWISRIFNQPVILQEIPVQELKDYLDQVEKNQRS